MAAALPPRRRGHVRSVARRGPAPDDILIGDTVRRRTPPTRGDRMTAKRRRTLTGLLYLAPAMVFVLVFTAYPFIQMVAMSFTSWSLITPPKPVGLNNFQAALHDKQFWSSLFYTIRYTIIITPILMVGGYLLALLVAPNSGLRRATRAIIFIPVVIGLGVSSLAWVWLFDPTFGLINKFLSDIGLIEKPIQFLGVDADLSTWSVIASVVWK